MNPKLTLSFTCVCISIFGLHAVATATEKKPAAKAVNEERKTVKKLPSPRNNNAVKIYPDIIRKAMHVVAKENDGKQIDFFVFDPEGTLMKHYRMNDGEHKIIDGLDRGKYVYNVFCGDEETAAGKFEIR
jgi:hypothetical protein